jgi:serine/threonine protein kinase
MTTEMAHNSLVGENISQYRVLREIGRGGMATVYEAEDTLLRRHVALKVIAESLLRDEEAIALFEREARAAAALDHPNICTVYELTKYRGRPVIVMELLEGESLRDAVRRGPLPIALVFDIAIEIADALEAAHAKGFVHRDIKPGNIMCNERGQVKLLDFGLAKSGDREGLDEEVDADGTVGGTVQYMSPEQITGEALDARSDLFSFGIVLYEMTTGQRPFQRRGGLATMEAIRTIHPASPRSLNPEVPEGLELIIAKLLEKHPANRYQSAADLRSDLEYLKLSLQAAESERGQAVSDTINGIPPIAAAEPPAVLASEEQLVTRVWRRRAWYVAPFVIAALLFLVLAGIVVYRRLVGG